MKLSRRMIALAFGAIATAAIDLSAADVAFAQGATDRPLRIVVPYPAGGPTDALARLIAKEIQEAHKRTAIVENKPGASGAIGSRDVARAQPDGSTLVLGTNQTHITNAVLLRDPGYDVVGDFVGVAGLAGLQHALVVPKSTDAGNKRWAGDLVAKAKAAPGKLNYGSTGLGSGSHLAMELFAARAGLSMTHVPFRGAAPMAIELVAGRIDAAFATLPSVLGQIQAGEIVALGLASAQRAPQLPGLPLLVQQGFKDSEADAWLALFAPRATPGDVVKVLSEQVTALMRKPEVTAAATKLGMVVDVRDSVAFATFLADERRKWLEVVRVAGLKAE